MRAALVHGLLPCTAVGGRGGPHEEMGVAHEGGSGDQSLPSGMCLLVRDWCGSNGGQRKTLLGAHPQSPVPPERKMAPPPTSSLTWMSLLSTSLSQGSHSSWKTWKNGDSFSSLEKSWNFVIFAKYPGKMRQTLEI